MVVEVDGGQTLDAHPHRARGPLRVGIVGLGAGTLARYGRKGDQIKKGGEMLNLLEIEDLILESGLCQECAAVGRKDEFWGDVYDIFVVRKPDDAPGGLKDRVQRYLNDALPVNQRPSSVVEIAEMPRTSSGKAVKRLVLYAETAQ